MHSSVENESTEQYTIHTIQVSVKRSQNLAQPKKNHGMIMSDSKFPHKNNWLYHPSKLLMYIKYINNNLITSTN